VNDAEPPAAVLLCFHRSSPSATRNTIEYEGTNAKSELSQIWLDPKLRFPVKWQGKGDGGELRNIQEGSQPASLFEIPAGFTKMDMGDMTQQRH